MKHVKLIGLCLVAVFALAGLVASVAQAEGPEWGRCLHIDPAKGKEIKKGNYEDPNCQTEATKLKKGVPVPSHKGHYEWYGGAKILCEKKSSSTFKYKDKECTTVATKKGVPDNKGKYELGPGQKFTAEGGAGVLNASIATCFDSEEELRAKPRQDCSYGGKPEYYAESVGKVECAVEHATGEAVGSDEVANVSVRFKGCAFEGFPATTVGLPAGEIQVNTLVGHLGYINKAKGEVGVLLEPAVHGGQFAEFGVLEEGYVHIHVGVGNASEGSFYEAFATPGTPNGGDGVIAPITPVNRMTHTFTQDYRGEEREFHCHKSENCVEKEQGLQFRNIPDSFEGGPLEVLEAKNEFEEGPESFEWGSAGEEITNVNTVEGEVEIKA